MAKARSKIQIIRDMANNRRLQEILNIEPRLAAILEEAKGIRRNPEYDRIRTYIRLRNQVIPLVGWFAAQEALHNSSDYNLVINTIVDLLPQDEIDIWPEGRPEKKGARS